MGTSNIMNLNNNTASERMGKPIRSLFLSKNGGKTHESEASTVRDRTCAGGGRRSAAGVSENRRRRNGKPQLWRGGHLAGSRRRAGQAAQSGRIDK